MSTRDVHYRNSPFACLVELVSDAFAAPFSRSAAPPRAQAVATAPVRKGWLDRLDQWFWDQRQKEREAYLAGSHDRFELEARLRELDRARYH